MDEKKLWITSNKNWTNVFQNVMHEGFWSTTLQRHQVPSRISGNATNKIEHNLHKALEITCRFSKNLKKIFGVQNNYMSGTKKETYPNIWWWHISSRFPPIESLGLTRVSLLIFFIRLTLNKKKTKLFKKHCFTFQYTTNFWYICFCTNPCKKYTCIKKLYNQNEVKLWLKISFICY